MHTDPGVAFLICRKGRVVTLQAKALLEAERAVQWRIAEIGWYSVEIISPPLVVLYTNTRDGDFCIRERI